MLANCLHDLAALGPGGLATLMGGLFLAGLAGGATHCAAMCAPFVLAQAAAGAERSAGGPFLTRLAGAALLPYHTGRVLGYAALGGLAGGAAGLVEGALGWPRLLLAGLLLLAALLMLGQAAARFGALLPARWQPAHWRPRPGPARRPLLPARWLGALLAAPQGWRGLGLGLLLSALPCGLLYGALAGAAASGSVLAGALAMAAFCLGTVPALVGVALLGRFFGRRAGPQLRLAGAALFALNAVLLGALAWRLLAPTA
ncbi:sulfite exporter TauE/SafE family protein [Pseudoroseomonas cervicalis]|uniref:urease accessory protein UreH domain-containing protein n=1 Tax=Teichococcus cervicalis TaxID=204525 RepID=UPI0027852962|nr:sulfite exporter TauE/SafE family protein [Pseudoroseomonas cervicalis]MDQ1079994.1 sulfite exporter TauE/SafE [Pseudoroseomonas cervicalis]